MIPAHVSPARTESQTERRVLFNNILDVTERMLALAEQSEWEQVTELESQRQQEISDFFSVTPAVEEAQWIADGIRYVLDADKRIVELGRKGLDSLSEKMGVVRTGHRACKEYETVRG